MKNIKIIYRVSTITFALLMLLDGYGGVSQQEAGKEAFRQLGYPMYLLIFLGVAKIIGAVGLLQTRFQIVKEWAFAGFAISFIGAAVSWAAVGGKISFIMIPVIMLSVMFIPYTCWKRYEQVKASS